MRRRWAAVAAALVVAVSVAGCSGVPVNSSPQVVRSIGLGESPAASPPAPPTGASQRTIVEGFLSAMATSPDRLDAARAFLDTDAAREWADTTVTVVADGSVRVGLEDPDTNQIVVSYQRVGSVSADGIYTPVLAGSGAAAAATATFTLARNPAGQWRIVTPVPPGLVLTESDFTQQFSPRPVYFLDAGGTRLVPDLRWSALSEPSLENFLVTQLTSGPRPELADGVAPFDPAVTGARRVVVTPGNPTVVQVPGASALDPAARRRLAAQLAYTLRSTSSFQAPLQIRDGSQVVGVVGPGDTFVPSDFSDLAPISQAPAELTYVRGGAVLEADGSPVSGALGEGRYDLDTAVFDDGAGRQLVAGTAPVGDGARRLLIGGTTSLNPTKVPDGPLSAPVWAPVGADSDVDEAWVARGGKLWRVDPDTGAAAEVNASGRNGPLSGTVTALAFSPEGSRLALVIRSTDGSSAQVWVGTVVRNGPDVRLDQVGAVTPAGVVVDDVGWRGETALAAVGTARDFSGGAVITFGVDGSQLELAAPDGLPDRPRTIAVSPRTTEQWVTVGTGSDATVWRRPSSVGAWSAPVDGAAQSGSSPSFST